VTYVVVAVGGGLGALARYGIEGVIAPRQRSPFPLSTLVVNVAGSFALGLLVGAGVAGDVSDGWLRFGAIGVIGGFTTFSTFTYETLRLIEDGAWRFAGLNLLASGPLAFAAAGLGYLIAR
jgi:fluoride exporter